MTKTESKNVSVKNTKKGFTLIELSIVLVIIGLIVGGVLVGQEMIRAAEIRSMISQVEKYNTSVNVFRNKYGGMPGDLNIATTFFAGGVSNGDGNLVITDTNGTVSNAATDFSNATGEIINFFAHLSSAGIVDGTYVSTASATPLSNGGNFPITKLGRGGIVPIYLDGTNRYHIGMATSDLSSVTTLTFTNSTLSPSEAYQVDLKMDDGVANTGLVVARTGTANTDIATAPASTGDNQCLGSAAVYNVGEANADQDTPLCQLQIRMN